MTGPDRYLTGRHAIVTGGGRGIGAAVAGELARLGATLTLMGRDQLRLEEQAERLRREHGDVVTAVPCDIADRGSVSHAFARARDANGDAYVLVNNAGQAEGAPFVETDRALWDRMIGVNLTGTYHCTREVLPAMLAAREGRIVNVASTAGLRGYARIVAYSASKHGVIGLTRSLALETVKHGVTVNAVCPGYTDTDMAQQAVDAVAQGRGVSQEEARQMIARPIPRGTLIEPEEVANAVAWLCSPGASAITGQSIAVAAGEVM